MFRYKLLISITIGLFLLCGLGCGKDKKEAEKKEVLVIQESKIKEEMSDTNIKQEQKQDWTLPDIASNYLANSGLPTRGYKYDGMSDTKPYIAIGGPQQLGSDFPLANNIAYFAEGIENEVKELKLVLNVNVPEKASNAHAILLKYSKILYQKALDKALPTNIRSSITNGTSGQWNFDKNTLVKLERDNWPTGKGYELHFTIEHVEAQ